MIKLSSPSNSDIEKMINRKESFQVLDIPDYKKLMEYCNVIESIIEGNNMSCRVKTKGRTAVGIPFIFTPPGWVYFGAQIIHNLTTMNPDWEITRNVFTKKIEVKFCQT